MLRCLVGKNVWAWESRLCQAEFAHNHASNRSLGFSPFQVVYSLQPRGPLDLTTASDPLRLHARTVEFVDALKVTHEDARKHLAASAAKYKTRADTKRREVIFQPGELV